MIGTLVAVSFTMVTTTAARQARPVDLSGIPALRPCEVVVTKDREPPDDVAKRYGVHYTDLYRFHMPGRYATGLDPKARNAFPLMRCNMVLTGSPESGFVGVTAFRRHWTGKGMDYDEHVVWEWKPPRHMRFSWAAWAGETHDPLATGDAERYWYLCLYPMGDDHTWPWDPVLLCFDRVSGLRWTVSLPIATKPGERGYEYDPMSPTRLNPAATLRGIVGCTPEGDRVIVMLYPYPNRNATWLYTVDGDGHILRRQVIQGLQGAQFLIRDTIPRRGDGRGFVINLRRYVVSDREKRPPEVVQRHESFLTDRDGNLVRRIVNSRGEPSYIHACGDRYAIGCRYVKDVGWEHRIYRLP